MDLKYKPPLASQAAYDSPRTNSDISLVKLLIHGLAVVGFASVVTSLVSQWQLYMFQPVSIQTTNDIFPDTDYPLRQATEPWDISKSYQYPRNFSKDVSEGTWLRIATHPLRKEIVFDMLGDLYCMPIDREQLTEAKPFLQGVPYDKEPEFSADGSKIVFISDSGFGVDNIWTLPYSTCEEMSKKSTESIRLSAIQQTNSTFRFFSSPAFHPTLPVLIATKWYLTGRPNGAGEIWEFPLQEVMPNQLPERGGSRIVARNLPASWGKDRYMESQLGAEQGRYVGKAGDGIIFTRNVEDNDSGKFSYNKDVHKGINAIFLFNTTTRHTTQLVDAFPGGANMPRMSHDGQTLAFIRRVKEKSVLVLKHLQSGTIQYAWSELTYDLSMIPAFMGAYPNYGFSANDDSIIIWSSGQIYEVPLAFNRLKERIASPSAPPQALPFRAHIDLVLGDTRYSETDTRREELADEGRVRALRGLRSDWKGEKVVFEAAGDTYLLDIDKYQKTKLSNHHQESQHYGPSFVHNTPYILHARWSDSSLTSFELINMNSDTHVQVKGIPRGRYISPVIFNHKIAFVRTGRDYMLGDVEETALEGVWMGDIQLPTDGKSGESALVTNLNMIDDSKASQDTKLDFKVLEGKSFLLILNANSITQYDVGDGTTETISTGKTSVEMAVSVATSSLNFSWLKLVRNFFSFQLPQLVAFRDFQHIWIGEVDNKHRFNIWSKPNDSLAPKHLQRLSENGGHDASFSGNGLKIFWLFGPHLSYVSVPEVWRKCATTVSSSRDSGTCAASLVQSQEVNVTYKTDLSNMKHDSGGKPVAFLNATVIPMDSSVPKIIEHGTVVIQNGVITYCGVHSQSSIPIDAHTINLSGGSILPGFIDVHGHWGGFLSQYPSISWELESFLGYGITTIHNPSSKNVGGYAERALVEKGAIYGPRIYHTGDVLYGSTQPNVYTEINSLNDARAALLRIKIEGGESSFSAKNYQLPARSARQRLLLEAKKLDMLIVPEGGWSFDWDMTYFIDGMTSLEHPVPIPELFDDVLSLIEASGSSYTTAAVMNYGGLFGQNWIHQHNNIPENEKLRKYVKHDILEALTEVKKAPKHSYQFFNTSISTRKLAQRGVRTNIGAHGEQPIGFLFHSEMLMHAVGGQSPYDILRGATINGAISLGLNSSIGSIEEGKLADLVIYSAGTDTIEKVWNSSMDMQYVVRGGRIFEVSDGLVEVWPRSGRRQKRGRINPEDKCY